MSITLKNLTLSYKRRPVVHHVSGYFQKGSSTAIVGPNGAGKSTLLKSIVGLLKPDHGEILFSSLTQDDIAYLPQRSDIDTSMPMTVSELVSTGLWHQSGAFGAISTSNKYAIQNTLEQVGLADYTNRSLFDLSNGQFQRVLFARLLVQDAPVIVLDEPFNAMDAHTIGILLELIGRWQHEDRTLISVLHDFEHVKQHFPQTLLLAHEVIAWGNTLDVLTANNLQQANQRCAHWSNESIVCVAPQETL